MLPAIAFSQSFLSQYKGLPYHDSRYQAGPQKIPGQVLCAYYDLGGEGVAYHDSNPQNQGSRELNPADGTYLNEFRIHPVAWEIMTEHLPCLSESVFVEACNISVSTAPLTPRPKSSSTSRSAIASLFRMITYAAVNDAPDAEEELHLRLAQSRGWARNSLFSRTR